MTSDAAKPVILVTGFGPFGEHRVNASWEAVKLLPCLWQDQQVEVRIMEIPVSYEYVTHHWPTVLQSVKPVFVVNVGVSTAVRHLTLEAEAHNRGYVRPDIDGRTPANGCCVNEPGMEEEEEVLRCGLDVKALAEQCGQGCGGQVKASCDAGRYLCEFVYFVSLGATGGRALFIHVPPLHQPHSPHGLAQALCAILQAVRGRMEAPVGRHPT